MTVSLAGFLIIFNEFLSMAFCVILVGAGPMVVVLVTGMMVRTLVETLTFFSTGEDDGNRVVARWALLLSFLAGAFTSSSSPRHMTTSPSSPLSVQIKKKENDRHKKI